MKHSLVMRMWTSWKVILIEEKIGKNQVEDKLPNSGQGWSPLKKKNFQIPSNKKYSKVQEWLMVLKMQLHQVVTLQKFMLKLSK